MGLVQILLAVAAMILAWMANSHKTPVRVLSLAVGLLALAFLLGFAATFSRLP